NNKTGDFNTSIGYLADMSGSALSNSTAIGSFAYVNASNKMQLGSSATILATTGGITIVSDGRFKEQIKQTDVPGLDFINKLKPVTYNFNYKNFDDFLKKDISNSNKSEATDAYQKLLVEKSKKRELGFVAQDVEKIVKDNNYTFNGVYTPQNDNDNYALDYSKFVVPLVKAVQELSKINDAKSAKIDTLQTQVNNLQNANTDLQKQFADLKNLVLSLQQKQQACNPCSNVSNSSQTLSSSVTLADAALLQNIPNPFNNTTTIIYSLPLKFVSAQIMITDKNGKTIKTINISGSGKGSLKLNASALSSGAYQYSLYVDKKLIDTKQMVLAK
ncbi:MAG TPA: tail fiber domain-containing protein, partial [Parafilimonas sp.]|nr:tail fiber domain-containing protein [Parafilimonas sp.]